MFSKKATKIDEIFIVDLTTTTYREIHVEDFVNFCGLLGKYELYYTYVSYNNGQIVSEGIFCVFKYPKKQKKINDFCPSL